MQVLRERVHGRVRIEHLATSLREAGLNVTAQRLAVFEVLKASRSHPTVEELYRALRRRVPGISRNTIYLSLEALRDLGETSEIWVDREAARFDPTSEPHDHAVCVQCKRIIDIWDLALRKVTLPRALAGRFRVMSHRVEFVGLCRACWRLPARRTERSRHRTRTRGQGGAHGTDG